MNKPTPEARALADDVATMANQLSALSTRAQGLEPSVVNALPAYYALNRAWHHLAAACDLLNGKEPRR